MDKFELENLVTNIVNSSLGLKGTDLVLKILSRDLEITNNECLDIVFDMIQSGDLIEIEYVLPNHYISKSFILPKDTHINIINRARIR
jgi:hypothetical protein